MMKRVKEVAISVIALAMVVALFGIVGHMETHYTVEGTVVAVSEEEVYVVTADGNEWAFSGEGYEEGDVVVMEMWTNGTDLNKYDDEIHAVKKIA